MRYLLVLLSLILTSCNSLGPIKSADFETILRSDIPDISKEILFAKPSVLYGGMPDFNFIGMVGLHLDRRSAYEGILILDSDSIVFAKWKSNKYNELIRVPYKNIKKVKFSKLLANVRIGIYFDDDSCFGLVVADENGTFVDLKSTEAACTMIANKSGNQCDIPIEIIDKTYADERVID